VRRFIGLPPHCIAREDTVLIEAMKPPAAPDEALPDSAAV
jgi:hypothetical protein